MPDLISEYVLFIWGANELIPNIMYDIMLCVDYVILCCASIILRLTEVPEYYSYLFEYPINLSNSEIRLFGSGNETRLLEYDT